MKDFFCQPAYGFTDTPETVKVLMDAENAPEGAPGFGSKLQILLPWVGPNRWVSAFCMGWFPRFTFFFRGRFIIKEFHQLFKGKVDFQKFFGVLGGWAPSFSG